MRAHLLVQFWGVECVWCNIQIRVNIEWIMMCNSEVIPSLMIELHVFRLDLGDYIYIAACSQPQLCSL